MKATRLKARALIIPVVFLKSSSSFRSTVTVLWVIDGIFLYLPELEHASASIMRMENAVFGSVLAGVADESLSRAS